MYTCQVILFVMLISVPSVMMGAFSAKLTKEDGPLIIPLGIGLLFGTLLLFKLFYVAGAFSLLFVK